MKSRLALLCGLLLPLGCRSATPPPSGPTFTIEGAVTRTGPQPMEGDVTVMEAVWLSKPLAEADLARVELVRPGEPELRLVVDVQRMFESGDSTRNVQVHAGDRLRVPAR